MFSRYGVQVIQGGLKPKFAPLQAPRAPRCNCKDRTPPRTPQLFTAFGLSFDLLTLFKWPSSLDFWGIQLPFGVSALIFAWEFLKFVLFEYIINRMGGWEEDARKGSAWWMKPLVRASRHFALVALKGQRGVIAMGQQFKASEMGGKRTARFTLLHVFSGTKSAMDRVTRGTQASRRLSNA